MSYSVPPLAELLSPAELESLANECRNNEDIYALLEAWGDSERRAEMDYWGWDFIAKQIWFQIQDVNVIRFAIYGLPGKGKSEIAQTIAFFVIGIYYNHNINITGWPIVARSPSKANRAFSKETKEGNTICLILDEKEREVGLGSKTNLSSLVQNLDTMRILRHSLIMIAITKEELGKLVSRCQIVFHAIFKDKKNQVNWCIMYVNDMEAKTLLPMAIIGIPMHDREWFRDWYEKDKMAHQVKFTTAGGRGKADSQNVIDAAERVMAYLKKYRLRPKSLTIREVIDDELHIALIGGEMTNTIARVQRLLGESVESRQTEDEEILWVGDKFDWKIQISSILKDITKFPKSYWKVWNFMEVEGLDPNEDKEKIKKITGVSYSAFMKWKKRMEDDESFLGWVRYQRGIMFEDFFAKAHVEAHGGKMEKKPKATINGKEYEEDLKWTIDDTSVFINTKCGTGRVNYVPNNYKTTHLIRTRLKRGAWVVYYDYENNVYSVFNPADSKIQVGSEKTCTLMLFETREYAETLENAQPLTARKVIQHPILLAALLNGVINLP